PLFLYTENPPSRPYTLSLHDALPIWFISHHTRPGVLGSAARHQPTHANILIGQKSPHLDWTRCGHRIRRGIWLFCIRQVAFRFLDRKSTRLNSSHVSISYAVFCLKKK